MMTALTTAISIVLAAQARPKAAAMVLDKKGKVEIRKTEQPALPARIGDLLWPGERLFVPADAEATVAVLGAAAQETIKPGSEATVNAKGCSPPESVLCRKEQPKAVAATMKNVRPAAADSRAAGVGFRAAAGRSLAVTPVLGSTVATDRPRLAWPPATGATTYRIKLLSGGGRELWRTEAREAAVVFPGGKEPLRRGFAYNWEVTDQDFRPVASGEFSVASESELKQFSELTPLAAGPDRADRLAAALAYRRLGAYVEATAACERLVKQTPGEPAYCKLLADLYRLAGRDHEAERAEAGGKPD